MQKKSRKKSIITDPDILAGYNVDALGLRGDFEAVFRPESEGEISEFVRECASGGKAITPQGLRSSLTGASICDKGVALSLERMNRIIDLDVDNRTAVAEPGVVLSEFRMAVSQAGLLYPPDPTSEAECTLGGSVCTNASGARGLAYGSTISWIRGLRLVDGKGDIHSLKGGPAAKNCSGYGAFYDPANIAVGSEGTLGILTRIEVSLAPKPRDHFMAIVFFPGLKNALNFVFDVRNRSDVFPLSLEFMDDFCLDIIRPKANGISIPDEAKVLVYFEQDYENEEQKRHYLDVWSGLIEKHTGFYNDTQIAITGNQKEHLYSLRHYVPAYMNEESAGAVKNGGCKISTDWTVPFHKLSELFDFYDTIKHMLGDMPVARFGHLGQGHPHFNFIARNREEKNAAEGVDLLMARKAVFLGGAIAGEHGIGKMKRNHLMIQYPQLVINSMKAVKKVFDPLGLLGPGNIFPP